MEQANIEHIFFQGEFLWKKMDQISHQARAVAFSGSLPRPWSSRWQSTALFAFKTEIKSRPQRPQSRTWDDTFPGGGEARTSWTRTTISLQTKTPVGSRVKRCPTPECEKSTKNIIENHLLREKI